jgi:hypothetical protein
LEAVPVRQHGLLTRLRKSLEFEWQRMLGSSGPKHCLGIDEDCRASLEVGEDHGDCTLL